MKIDFTARHFKAADRIKNYAEKEVKRLERYYDGIINCEIILDRDNNAAVAEIILRVYGKKLIAKEQSDEMSKSVDLAVSKLERILKKYKSRLKDHSA
ncbi:MAG: ribosome hibernation-promoting factor, HPF/YfiA family [Fidelibacterota bacterium]